MKLDQPLVHLFDRPVDDILAALPDAASPLWEADRSRQTTYAVHRLTRSILFEWLDNGWQAGMPIAVQPHSYAPPELSAPCYAYAAALQAMYPGSKLVRMTLAELVPHGRIPTHVDNGMGVTAVHRCHVPLETGEKVHFYIDRVSHYLKTGSAYEFDNTRSHAVDNQSDRRRVHLLCDFMPAMLLA